MMKSTLQLLLSFLLVVFLSSGVFGAGDTAIPGSVVVETSNEDAAHLRVRRVQTSSSYPSPADNTTTVIGSSVPACILGLRWMNADTNQPLAVEEYWTKRTSVWAPLGWPDRISYPYFITDRTIRTIGKNTTGMSLEAVTQGPVASVVFERRSYDASTGMLRMVRNVENNAQWTMCTNAGADIFACNATTFWGSLFQLNVTAYSRKGGTGEALHSVQTFITTVQTTPSYSLYIESPTLATRIPLSPTNVTTVSLAQTSPNITIGLYYQNVGKFQSIPNTAVFNYDNGTIVSTQTKANTPNNPQGFWLFLGMVGTNQPKYFKPTIGRHTLQMTMDGDATDIPTITFDVTA